jgi:cytochrome c peroxidase
MKGKKNIIKILIPMLVMLLVVSFSVLKAKDSPLKPKEQLGKEIFFDKISDPINTMSCADCHAPNVGWTGPDSEINKHGGVYMGAVPQRFGNRKPPSSGYATPSPIFHLDTATGQFVGGNFWDGRATGERLGNPAAEQALGPFLNPLEQNNPNKEAVLKHIAKSKYASLWKQVWHEKISYATPADIDKNYDRVGLSIAAYEASEEVNQFSSKYDYYLKGKADLTPQEDLGLELFNGKANCVACHTSTTGRNHNPPLFTDFTFDNLGVPKNPENPFYDMGPTFNPDGHNWIDPGLGGFLATRSEWASLAGVNMGKHKVPTLRNVDKRPGDNFTKAYMNNGVFKSLEEVVHFYNTRDDGSWDPPEVPQNMNTIELGNLGLTPAEEAAIVAFLKTLTDGYTPNHRHDAPPLLFHTSAYQNAPEFKLYQNTPNPFNPETWLPFSLGSEAKVVISIHDLQGRLIRKLDLGTKPAGIYSEKGKAVYWDGKNEAGEQVSSGIYFYTIQAGQFTATKKMIIQN